MGGASLLVKTIVKRDRKHGGRERENGLQATGRQMQVSNRGSLHNPLSSAAPKSDEEQSEVPEDVQ